MNKGAAVLFGIGCLNAAAAGPVEFLDISQQCEEALALSALPEPLRPRASVYVWRGDGFEKTVSSDGGFHCLVQRNHPDSIIPECVTSTGESSILQGIMAQTKLTAAGLSADEVRTQFEAKLASGEIPAPEQPGVNYMMSAYNLIYNADRDTMLHIPPHAMMFAPNASREVIGGSFREARETAGVPFVAEAGTHSYIITFTERSGSPDQVQQACAGQLDLPDAFASPGP